MILSQVVIELRHSEPLKLFAPYEELYRSLTDEELPEKGVPLPGFQLNVPKKMMRITVDPKRTAVIMGDVPSIHYCVDNSLAVFRKISDIVKLPTMQRLGIRSYWFEESEFNFVELTSVYKEKMYQPTEFAKESIDVGASFVIKEGDCAMNIAFGPMEQSQLVGMLAFKTEKLPKVVSFLDVDFYRLLEKEKVTQGMIREFVVIGLESASKQAERLMKILPRKE